MMEVTTAAKGYKIQASSPSDKRLWVSDIKKCIAKFTGAASDPNSAASMCEGDQRVRISACRGREGVGEKWSG